ncbi:MAG: porin [Motiliproteus sp.]
MKNNKVKLLAVAVAMGISAQASAAITLYDNAGTTFAADGHINVFYTQTDDEVTGLEQDRVRMGFLPNYIGFTTSKQVDGLTLGARSSFWVTINDGGSSAATDTAIDVRQFYGTVDSDFGQFLFGKDFGLFARSNIFNDELLLGTGLPKPQGPTVTFGNISTGYPYATPVAQLTYRTNDINGFKLAVGIMDPESGEAAVGSDTNRSARFEAEATYNGAFDGGSFVLWLNGASGESATAGVDATGVGYGARVTVGGLQVTASGFDSEGIGALADDTLVTEDDSDGYLLQASYSFGNSRIVLSTAETDTKVFGASTETSNKLDAIAYFHKINDNLQVVAEYDTQETSTGADIDQIAVGAVLSW